ncbi:hypothetical protein O181_066396 [Austropuccinia psidii MF-1]|uniref:Uncharacterized protein n=1 Tax=Austropuccinia psidii MF-1 TaxID=1389203 RepID=A0A9Q3EQV8_9BASI|nr:hypothetical protein [Austropuccinia psidii MF-1]
MSRPLSFSFLICLRIVDLEWFYHFKYVSDKASELTSTASKEANKSVAKDSSNSLGTRATAAKVSFASRGNLPAPEAEGFMFWLLCYQDAASDKVDELKNSASAEVNKVCFLIHYLCLRS